MSGTEIKRSTLPRAALRASGERRTKGPKARPLVWAEYLTATILLAMLRRLPLPVVYRIAESIAWLLYAIPRFRRRSLANLEVAFGAEQSPESRRRLLKASLVYQAWSFADILLAPRLLNDPRHAGGVDLSELEQALSAERGRGEHGVLLVASHQGTPEIGSLELARRGWPHAVVARKLDNPRLWKALLDERAAFPRQVLTKTGALRPAYRTLKEGGIVAIQIDQDAKWNGIFVPYFGTPASTHAGAGSLAVVSGLPVYLISCIRTAPRRFRHKVYCSGPWHAQPTGDLRDDVLRITARLTAEIETMARRFPEQVFWLHRRWKTRPPEEGGQYAGGQIYLPPR